MPDPERILLFTFGQSVPLKLIGELGPAVEEPAERAGWTDVVADMSGQVFARRKTEQEEADV